MEIAVLGGGNGGYAAAAELAEKGHRVRLWRRDAAALAPVLECGSISLIDGKGEREVAIPTSTASLQEAISGAALILIALPATAHETLAKTCAPLWEDGQVVLLTPGCFGSYIFWKEFRAAGNSNSAAFGEAATLPHVVRKRGPRQVMVRAYASRLPTAFFPLTGMARALATATVAYPAITSCEDPLAAALLNAGPIMHPPLILMNMGPIEHFDVWDIHREGTQPPILRVINAIDAERVRVREALGYGAPHYPIADHYAGQGKWMYGAVEHVELAESDDWREHIDINTHRYVYEDIAIGLSLLSSLAKRLEVDAPIVNGLLNIASAGIARDLLGEGRTLERLGLADVSGQDLLKILHGPEPL